MKVALILSGCGYLDGSEIHETTLSLLALEEASHEWEGFAPDRKQLHVVNHSTEETTKEDSRNILKESARPVRGKITTLEDLNPDDWDALILPGGYGVAKNLSYFASENSDCIVDSLVEKAILAFHAQKKPIGAICIAPVLIAKAFQGKENIKLTLGNDPSMSEVLEKMGMTACEAARGEAVIDEKHKIISTPAYMYDDTSLVDVFTGIKALVKLL